MSIQPRASPPKFDLTDISDPSPDLRLFACYFVFTDTIERFECDAVLMVASKIENNGLYLDLKAQEAEWTEAGIKSVKLIGDANAPGPIAWATYAGHRYARELDEPDLGDAIPFRREITELAID